MDTSRSYQRHDLRRPPYGQSRPQRGDGNVLWTMFYAPPEQHRRLGAATSTFPSTRRGGVHDEAVRKNHPPFWISLLTQSLTHQRLPAHTS